uniref:diaminopimelate epimerase n=1 Tax=Cyanobium sp. TaxID=2164130 RepID=UPI00404882E4
MLQFSKYQGLGNDFLMLDGRDADSTAFCFELTPGRIQRLCDRRFGVGGDGVILALPPQEGGELRMRIFNADGTEPEMCGNGIRCLARFLADSDGDQPGREWQIETLAGRIVPRLEAGGVIRVDMGPPFLEPGSVPTTLEIGNSGIPQGELDVDGEAFLVGAAGMGNPHVVIPVADVQAIDLERFGAQLEVHPAFPAKTNVHFVQALNRNHLVMRVWERGAGPTLACGTGACATLVVCHSFGIADRQARLDLPGGPLEIAWDAATGHVFMTGPAEAVFDGVVTPDVWGDEGLGIDVEVSVDGPGAAKPPAETDQGHAPVSGMAPIDCATACTTGCQRPEACPSAEARARVAALLNSSSLDDLVNLATSSLEARTRARIQPGPGRQA